MVNEQVYGMLIGSCPHWNPIERIKWAWRNRQCLRGRHLWMDERLVGRESGREIELCAHCLGHRYAPSQD